MSTALLDLDKLVINGTSAKKTMAVLTAASTGVTMTETITGASTVEINVQDVDRKLLRSTLLSGATTLVLDGAAFELAAVNKAGSSLRLVFEDITVAALRKHDSFRKVNPGHMSRAAFVRDLVRRDENWVKVHTTSGPTAKVELSRGKAKGSRGGAAQREDTWTAATRIMGEIGWRVYARRGGLYVLPDSYLLDQAPYLLSEDSSGVDDIDFDYDVGKPAATASMTVRAGAHALTASSAVILSEMGVADGKWLVETITRTPSSKTAGVKLIRPQPKLPEPVDVSDDKTGDKGDDGWDAFQLPHDDDIDGSDPDRGSAGRQATSDVEKFIRIAKAQIGKPYQWGASGPGSFDCSGLVQYSAKRVGFGFVHKPVTSLYSLCRTKGRLISVAEATRTRGALLIRVGKGGTNHVAISLGNGTTMEAMGRAYGCRIGRAAGRSWNHGGLLPGLFIPASTRTHVGDGRNVIN